MAELIVARYCDDKSLINLSRACTRLYRHADDCFRLTYALRFKGKGLAGFINKAKTSQSLMFIKYLSTSQMKELCELTYRLDVLRELDKKLDNYPTLNRKIAVLHVKFCDPCFCFYASCYARKELENIHLVKEMSTVIYKADYDLWYKYMMSGYTLMSLFGQLSYKTDKFIYIYNGIRDESHAISLLNTDVGDNDDVLAKITDINYIHGNVRRFKKYIRLRVCPLKTIIVWFFRYGGEGISLDYILQCYNVSQVKLSLKYVYNLALIDKYLDKIRNRKEVETYLLNNKEYEKSVF